MIEDFESNEELISEGEPIQGLPKWIKIITASICIIILSTSVFLMWKYVEAPQQYASPKELQLVNLIIFSLSILILVLVPWNKMGIRIRKIGTVEFDRVVSGQARENAEEFAELRARIEELEGRTDGMDEINSITEHFSGIELRPLLLKFLKSYEPKAYSPLKIYKWGSRQSGFEKLSNHSQGMIRKILQNLVVDGEVSTRVSRLGNTLYKIKD